MPNKPLRFWHELKRRNVIRVLTVYIAASFMILELITMISEPFELPEGIMKVAVFIALIGLVFAAIFSWVYDKHPELGLIKTKTTDKDTAEEIPISSHNWKIASYISFVVIVGLVILNIIPRLEKNVILEKSIAILPFINDSPDKENEYFINGIMEEMLIMLQAIEDFRIPGRTSIEKYRYHDQSIPEIASELGVNYVVEGSGQRYGNTFVLRIQLLEAHTGMHLWGESIETEIKSVETITSLQSSIAKSIAEVLEVVIDPEAQENIERAPTTSLLAYDYYLRAREGLVSFLLNTNNYYALLEAEEMFLRSLRYDTTFSHAYAGLGMIRFNQSASSGIWGERYTTEYFKNESEDSITILADLAVLYDSQNEDAYTLLGYKSLESGDLDLAQKYLERALQINPNHSLALIIYGYQYARRFDYVNAISQLYQAVEIEKGTLLPFLHEMLYFAYWAIGFDLLAENHLNKLISITNDSIKYYSYMSSLEELRENLILAAEYSSDCYFKDTLDVRGMLDFGEAHYYQGNYYQSYLYNSKYFNTIEASGLVHPAYMHRMGHILWNLDKKEEAKMYFDRFQELAKISIQRNNFYGKMGAHYDLAGMYSLFGKKELAYKHLENYSETNISIKAMLNLLKTRDPLFESIRHERRFQNLIQKMEIRYQTEHDRVNQWLEENEML